MATRPATKKERLDEYEEFRNGFKRSKRKSLYRQYDDATLVVFRQRRNAYSWCIDREKNDFPEYSSGTFQTEADALWDLGNTLMIGHEYLIEE